MAGLLFFYSGMKKPIEILGHYKARIVNEFGLI